MLHSAPSRSSLQQLVCNAYQHSKWWDHMSYVVIQCNLLVSMPMRWYGGHARRICVCVSFTVNHMRLRTRESWHTIVRWLSSVAAHSLHLSVWAAAGSSPGFCWQPSRISPCFPPCITASNASVLVLSCSKPLARPSISPPENKMNSLVSKDSKVKQH